jgi:hypothetical protein
MVKVGGGEDLLEPIAADRNCDKKEDWQETTDGLAEKTNQEDGPGAQDIDTDSTLTSMSDDEIAGMETDVTLTSLGDDEEDDMESDKEEAVDEESSDDNYKSDVSDSDSDDNYESEDTDTDTDDIYESDDSDIDHDSGSEVLERRIFYVHKSVLCKTSSFFQNVTKPEWTASTPRPIDLSDEDAKIFQFYVQWLYSGTVAIQTRFINNNSDAEGGLCEIVDKRSLIESYLLGEKLMDTTFQNAVMQGLIQCVTREESYPLNSVIKRAYKRTTPQSPLRRLLVDFWVWNGNSTWMSSDMDKELGTEFMNDLIWALLEKRPDPDSPGKELDAPWLMNPKAYAVTGR